MLIYVDNVSMENFEEIKNVFRTYSLIRRFQIRWRIRTRCKKERAAKIIQRGLHNWLWKPVCRDGTVGIGARLSWKSCMDLRDVDGGQ